MISLPPANCAAVWQHDAGFSDLRPFEVGLMSPEEIIRGPQALSVPAFKQFDLVRAVLAGFLFEGDPEPVAVHFDSGHPSQRLKVHQGFLCASFRPKEGKSALRPTCR